MEIVDHVRQLKWNSSSRPSQWDEEVLFTDGDSYFADLLDGIGRAERRIDLETYIFEAGHLAERLTAALLAAARRGVEVRVLVDGIGSPRFWSEYGAKLRHGGVAVRLFRAWPWQLRWLQQPWINKLYEFIRRWRYINRGNHRKVCLIDQSRAWIGSFNVADVHLNAIAGPAAWVDIGVRIRGWELGRLERAFDCAFTGELLQSPMQPMQSLLLLNSSFLLRRSAQHHQIKRLKRATRRVWIQTPYFVPIRPLYRRLLRLSRKGVDVRLMVPAQSDVPLVKALSTTFFRQLLDSGCRIFEYQPRFMHQKIMHIDDWISIGSSNLNHRSFFHDLEVDVTITSERNRLLLQEKFKQEQVESRELTAADLDQVGWLQNILNRMLLLLRYWS